MIALFLLTPACKLSQSSGIPTVTSSQLPALTLTRMSKARALSSFTMLTESICAV